MTVIITAIVVALSLSLAVSLFFCIRLNTAMCEAIRILKFYARVDAGNSYGTVARIYLSKWGF